MSFNPNIARRIIDKLNPDYIFHTPIEQLKLMIIDKMIIKDSESGVNLVTKL